MASSSDTEKQANQEWHTRFAKERLSLSASVEEALAAPGVDEDLLVDEPECAPNIADEPISDSHKVAIIPPKISLQSRAVPVVHLEPRETVPVAKVEEAATPTTNPVATPGRDQKRQRLGGRTTKVRLQAVSKIEQKPAKKVKPEKKDLNLEREEVVAGRQTLAGDRWHEPDGASNVITERPYESSANKRGKLSGFGIFEPGQEEVMISNPLISSSSVVIVMLTNDPGPVVVHYITLHPSTGFTIHLSAQALKQTTFNYVILMTELF